MKTYTDSDAIGLVNATDLKMRELYRNNRRVSPDTTFAGLVLYSEELDLRRRDEFGCSLSPDYPNHITLIDGPDRPRPFLRVLCDGSLVKL